MPKVTSHAALTVAATAAEIAAATATGGASAEITEGLKLAELLEPPIAHAVAALIQKLHAKHAKSAGKSTAPPIPSEPSKGAAKAVPASELPEGTKSYLPSTSLDPNVQAP